jgi:hypothetical protein
MFPLPNLAVPKFAGPVEYDSLNVPAKLKLANGCSRNAYN